MTSCGQEHPPVLCGIIIIIIIILLLKLSNIHDIRQIRVINVYVTEYVINTTLKSHYS